MIEKIAALEEGAPVETTTSSDSSSSSSGDDEEELAAAAARFAAQNDEAGALLGVNARDENKFGWNEERRKQIRKKAWLRVVRFATVALVCMLIIGLVASISWLCACHKGMPLYNVSQKYSAYSRREQLFQFLGLRLIVDSYRLI